MRTTAARHQRRRTAVLKGGGTGLQFFGKTDMERLRDACGQDPDCVVPLLLRAACGKALYETVKHTRVDLPPSAVLNAKATAWVMSQWLPIRARACMAGRALLAWDVGVAGSARACWGRSICVACQAAVCVTPTPCPVPAHMRGQLTAGHLLSTCNIPARRMLSDASRHTMLMRPARDGDEQVWVWFLFNKSDNGDGKKVFRWAA